MPGVGKSIATDLFDIGIRYIDGQKGNGPQQLYDSSNYFAGLLHYRCYLYVFRLTVYFAKTPKEEQDIEKQK